MCMNLSNLVIILIVAIIVILTSVYIYKTKKNGAKCIGCPEGNSCANNCTGECSGCSGCPSGCSHVGKFYSK